MQRILNNRATRGLLLLIFILAAFYILRYRVLAESLLYPENSPFDTQGEVVGGEGKLVMGIPLNINSASMDDLKVLPGIGEKMAERIVRMRDANGPFLKVEDLLNVRGIGRKRLNMIRELVTCAPIAESAGQ